VFLGAHVGDMEGDLIFKYLKDRKQWSDLLVEPIPALFEKLRINCEPLGSRVKLENSAISNVSGTLPFYVPLDTDD